MYLAYPHSCPAWAGYKMYKERLGLAVDRRGILYGAAQR